MIYLASQSPQRAMLLRRANLEFQVVASRANEETVQLPQPQMLALERARAKARGAVLSAAQRDARVAVALGADTVVALGNTVFGKPVDRAEAYHILSQLQGTTHSVFTGQACVRFNRDGGIGNEAVGLATARITMRRMSDAEIESYVATGESDNRSGGYAIQETADRFVSEMQGSWDTVVGLHVALVARLYQECADEPPAEMRP